MNENYRQALKILRAYVYQNRHVPGVSLTVNRRDIGHKFHALIPGYAVICRMPQKTDPRPALHGLIDQEVPLTIDSADRGWTVTYTVLERELGDAADDYARAAAAEGGL
jgi:hypothetical protein